MPAVPGDPHPRPRVRALGPLHPGQRHRDGPGRLGGLPDVRRRHDQGLGRPIPELPIWFIEIYVSGRGSSRHCQANILYYSSLAKGIAIPETTIKFGWFCFGQ